MLDFGFVGLWMSIILAQVYLCFAMHYLVESCDWQQVADETEARMKATDKVAEILDSEG